MVRRCTFSMKESRPHPLCFSSKESTSSIFSMLHMSPVSAVDNVVFNLKKTQCMLIGTSQKLSKCRKLCVNVGDVLIENVKCAKLLGINIDECLWWSVHIDVLCKNLQLKIAVLRRLSSFMPRAALLKIFNTIIFLHFNYCCTVWGTSILFTGNLFLLLRCYTIWPQTIWIFLSL